VHRPGHAAFLIEAPYVFVAAMLAEGPLMYGRMMVPPDAKSLSIGSKLRVVFPEGATGAVLPAFATS
jgi:hypothetical protein